MPLGSGLRSGLAEPLLPLTAHVAFNPGGPELLGHPTVSPDLLSLRSATLFGFAGEGEWGGDSSPFQASAVGGGALLLTHLAVPPPLRKKGPPVPGSRDNSRPPCCGEKSEEEVHGGSVRAE